MNLIRYYWISPNSALILNNWKEGARVLSKKQVGNKHTNILFSR